MLLCKNMRKTLKLTYFSLISITIISSFLLFYVVASENTKSAAVYADVNTITNSNTSPWTPEIILNINENKITNNLHWEPIVKEKVLPNYKKVKKLSVATKTKENARPALTSANVATLESDLESGGQNSIFTENKNAYFKQIVSVSSTRTPLVNSVSDVNIVEKNDQNSGGVIIEVPKVDNHVIQNENIEKVESTKQATQKSGNINFKPQDESLPDITEIPTVTVTELPFEVLEPTRANLESIIIDPSKAATQGQENQTVDIVESDNKVLHKDEQIIKINDSGGGTDNVSSSVKIPKSSNKNIPSEDTSKDEIVKFDDQTNAGNDSGNGSGDSANSGSTVNLTVEEVPIPVFSEWAQKQMEAAEKQQLAKEQEVVSTVGQKKNHTNGNGKQPLLKLRSKNYASPDCGAKIIASNSDASSTHSVLSASKDEYMLSPCGNRIWFVVELCEAIQAQKIDLANFELFSSSPKNFTVAVSTRFPTRDWSNVGRFVAEDKRSVQNFELHPHLYGKFVRVDIYSHYSKEHFCPVSLFRVFGTSEFEAFETENLQTEDLDDFDDEFPTEQGGGRNEPNLFKSASDAVLSIVKKAAEVLVKPVSSNNQAQKEKLTCHTTAYKRYNCAECNKTLVELINNALTCEMTQLNKLLSIKRLRRDLLNTQICAKKYGFEKHSTLDSCQVKSPHTTLQMDIKQSYFLSLLPTDYVGALCFLYIDQRKQTQSHSSSMRKFDKKKDGGDLALNLTIEKKLRENDFKLIEKPDKNLLKPKGKITGNYEKDKLQNELTKEQSATTDRTTIENEQLQRPPKATNEDDTTTAPILTKDPPPDVNIFNVPHVENVDIEKENIVDRHMENKEESTEPLASSKQSASAIPTVITETTTAMPNVNPTTIVPTTVVTAKSDEDNNNGWESIDNLLSSTIPPNGQGTTIGNNVANSQQKLSNGAQSESIFIRLSNRIKALERNMSLSGQYLEELSRRYKKQVEELQITLTQNTQTVRLLEEQNRRHSEVQVLFSQRNAQLKTQLDDLALQVHACIVVIISLGAFVLVLLVVGILLHRTVRRGLNNTLIISSSKNNKTVSLDKIKLLSRRKSFEDSPQITKKVIEKLRRPSEEVVYILKHCSVNANDSNEKKNETQTACTPSAFSESNSNSKELRQRKISICYGINNINETDKRTWPNNTSLHIEDLKDYNPRVEKQHKFFTKEKSSHYNNNEQPNTKSQSNGNEHQLGLQKVGKAKKRAQQLKRRSSALTELVPTYDDNKSAVVKCNRCSMEANDYDESLMLDDEGLDNFIPNSDMVYNEFMPEGPSGFQIITDEPTRVGKAAATAGTGTANNATGANIKVTTKKSKRLTSPAFFKSPFNKNTKVKGVKQNPPHESTSWEWYRLRKSEQHMHQLNPKLQNSTSNDRFMQNSSPPSIDSISLSEINFPTNSTSNSFRILEEAILSSGECASTTNGNGHSGSSGDSNRSSSSSSSKKKSRSFNKIFRKVF